VLHGSLADPAGGPFLAGGRAVSLPTLAVEHQADA
jgi:hypothetical protein